MAIFRTRLPFLGSLLFLSNAVLAILPPGSVSPVKPEDCQFRLSLGLEGEIDGHLNLRGAVGISLRSRAVNTLAKSAGKHLLKVDGIEAITLEATKRVQQGEETYAAIIAAMGVTSHFTPEDLARIPATGPLVVTSNHPLSGVDGMLVASFLKKVRPDVKVLMTTALSEIPLLKDHAFFINMAKPEKRTLIEMMKWVSDGHALMIFPSGRVSNRDGWKEKTSHEQEWLTGAAGIAARSHAQALPIYVGGAPTRTLELIRSLPDSQKLEEKAPFWKKILAKVRGLLFNTWFTREILAHRNHNFSLAVGEVVTPKELDFFQDEKQKYDLERMTLFLRARTLELAQKLIARDLEQPQSLRIEVPLREPVDPEVITREMTALDASGQARLLESGEYQIFVAKSDQIPNSLQELGRLRELTFRQVGEGTGLATDLDRFDLDYHHLILWDKQNKRIAGAYRLGVVKDILAKRGVRGIYTTTLFNFDGLLKSKLSNGMELGRSFVVPDYQRKPKPLFLLLKGIAAFLARNPSIKDLFGPVSISNAYTDTSKRLLMAYIEQHLTLNQFTDQVSPKNPPLDLGPLSPAQIAKLAEAAGSLKDVSKMVAMLEPDGKSLPVLYLKYADLGAGFLGFNHDQDFNSYDGLIWTDVSQLPIDKLSKFMEPTEAETYLRFHGKLP